MQPEIIVTQLAMARYRQNFLGCLADFSGMDTVRFYVGAEHLQPELLTAVDSPLIVRINNRFFLGRRFAWQPGVIGAAMSAPIAVLELNPRILSSWLVLFGRRFLRRPTYLWGHVHPRAGARGRTARIRHVYRCLGTGTVCYTDAEAHEARALHPRKPAFVAPNAIERHSVVPDSDDGRHFLYSGRLIPEKGVDLVIRAFASVVGELPQDSDLLLVGGGRATAALKQLAEDLHVSRRVRFLGSVYDPHELASLYASSAAAVAPGYAGLNVLQAVAHGTRVILAKTDSHAPEAHLLGDDFGIWAEDASIAAFADAMRGAAALKRPPRARAQRVVDRHNAESMAKGLLGVRNSPR